MKLLIIRHGDPDYERDGLTDKGKREAAYLADRLAGAGIDACYVSPMGRARDTAAPALARLGMAGEECPWLREFTAPIVRPDRGSRRGSAGIGCPRTGRRRSASTTRTAGRSSRRWPPGM